MQKGDTMELVTIRYKNGFRIEERAKIYPLMCDIKDDIGVLS